MARRRTPSIMNFHTDTGIVLKGDQGYSAYEIAVQNGFIGTEAEWLESLKGNATKAEQYAKEAGSYREEVKRSAIDAGNSAKLASDTVKNIGNLQKTLESATVEAVRKLNTATDEANKVERLTRSEAAVAELSRKQADIDARETKRLQKLVSNGELVGVCDKPRFVMKNPKSGAYIQTTEENAEGIAVRGTLFNINGKEIIPDAPMAIIREMDGFEMLFDNSKETKQQKAQIDQNRADVEYIAVMADIDLGEEK